MFTTRDPTHAAVAGHTLLYGGEWLAGESFAVLSGTWRRTRSQIDHPGSVAVTGALVTIIVWPKPAARKFCPSSVISAVTAALLNFWPYSQRMFRLGNE